LARRPEIEVTASQSGVPGVVLRGTGGVWVVRIADGSEHDAMLRGRLKQSAALKLAVGDEVSVAPAEKGGGDLWTIEQIAPRRSVLARRAPGGRVGERVVAANVDQVVVVFAVRHPDPHRRMIDRCLTIAEGNGLRAELVINKIDLVDRESAEASLHDYAAAGYRIHFTSARTGVGLEALRESLAGRTSALAGPSGVGKSSLMNALYPGLDLRVGAISPSVDKGRHTTVGAWMHPLPDGGYVVDTPGLREVGLWGLPSEHLDACFPEIRPYLGSCQFRDCAHIAEPGCRVREAVESGHVSRERYDSYLKLRAEIAETERR